MSALRSLTSAVFAGLVAVSVALTSSPAVTQDYALTAADRKFTCRQVAGRMQVRILQLRTADPARRSSLLAQAVQGATTSVLGGSRHGSDLSAQDARDLAQLKAYNSLLAEKRCPTFDLAAELASTSARDTPRPQVPAK